MFSLSNFLIEETNLTNHQYSYYFHQEEAKTLKIAQFNSS